MRLQIRIGYATLYFATMVFAIQCQSPTDQSNSVEVTPDPRAGTLPDSLTTKAFAELIRELSEPGGRFHSANYTSNESSYLHPFTVLRERRVAGGVYVGVGPEQNFTYIAEIRPHMAFVVDIRRQNMLLHLIYKALFVISDDRAEFLSRLLGKPLNNDLSYLDRLFRGERVWSQSDSESSVADLIAYFEEVDPDIDLFEQNLRDMKSLLKSYGIDAMTDMETVDRVLQAFFKRQLDIHYDTGSLGDSFYDFPNLRELILATTLDGEKASFLATDRAFATVKEMHEKNLIIPMVGDFAGEKALRGISDYVRSHDATISLFYVSNVEQYLTIATYHELQKSNESDEFDPARNISNLSSNKMQESDGLSVSTFSRYFDNVSSMPTDESSLLIRSYANDNTINMMSHPRRIKDHPFTSFVQNLTRFTEDESWRSLKGYDDYIQLVTEGIMDDYVVPTNDRPLILPPRMTASSDLPEEYSHLDDVEIVVSVRFDSGGIVDTIWTASRSGYPALDSLALERISRFRLKPNMGTLLIVPPNMIFNYKYRLASRN